MTPDRPGLQPLDSRPPGSRNGQEASPIDRAEALLLEAQRSAAALIAEAEERARGIIAEAQAEPDAQHALAEAEQHFATAMESLLDGAGHSSAGVEGDGVDGDERLRGEISTAVGDWLRQLEDLPRAKPVPASEEHDRLPTAPEVVVEPPRETLEPAVERDQQDPVGPTPAPARDGLRSLPTSGRAPVSGGKPPAHLARSALVAGSRQLATTSRHVLSASRQLTARVRATRAKAKAEAERSATPATLVEHDAVEGFQTDLDQTDVVQPNGFAPNGFHLEPEVDGFPSNGSPPAQPATEEPEASPPASQAERSRAERWRRLYMEASERGGRRVAVALVGIAVAYHYSLVTLMRTLDVDTPLAYLGLVPFIALILVAARHAAPNHEPPIHDRQLDYIVGVPLLLAALAMVALLPVRLSTLFWVWRVDLLSLPLFVAGTVAVVFGVRALWRLRLPIGFLLLAWPVPYTWFLNNWLQTFTDVTIAAVRLGVGVLGVAGSVPGPNGIFAIPHHGAPFQVSVASACSGVNSMVGFLLVGSAFAALVRGRRLPKVAWLFGGLVLIWALNVFRILVILAVGRQWGEGVAIDGFHPVLGLFTFSFGVVVMILVMPRFGLRMLFQPERRDTTDGAARRLSPTTSRPAVPRARLALSVVAAAAVLLAAANAGLRDYELVADDLGQPRLAAYSDAIAGPPGWDGYQSDSYSWAKRYFGEDSTWRRYLYQSSAAPGASAFRSPSPVITDVISTSDLSSFSNYGLEACYNFHGYRLYSTKDVDLGGGITGKVLSYYHPKLKKDWTSVYWHWPVKAGGEKRFERVVMMMVGTEQTELAAPAPRGGVNLGIGVTNRLQSSQDKKLDQSLERTGSFLVSFAQETVARHGTTTGPPPPGTPPPPVAPA